MLLLVLWVENPWIFSLFRHEDLNVKMNGEAGSKQLVFPVNA